MSHTAFEVSHLPLAGPIWMVCTGLGLAVLVLVGTIVWTRRQRRLPQEPISATSGVAFLMGLATLSGGTARPLSPRAAAETKRAYSTVLTRWAHDEYGIDLSPDGANRLALQHDPIIAVSGKFIRVSLDLRTDGALMLVTPSGQELATRMG